MPIALSHIDWCEISSSTERRPSVARCKRCGKGERVPFPMPVSAFLHWSRYFRVRHQYCQPKPEAKP